MLPENYSLEDVLSYSNKSVVQRFLKKYDVSEAEAEELFFETKKWLWLSAESITDRRDGKNSTLLFIDTPLYILDEMWHNFILFTIDYSAFCHKYFGFFIHHQPEITDDIKNDKMTHSIENGKGIVIKQYSYIYDKLGEATLIKWYSEFPEKYTPTAITEIKH